MVLAAAGAVPAFLSRTSRVVANSSASSPYGSDTILVVVQMSGGNDGLNMVVPFGLDGYHEARPTIGIDEDAVIPLEGAIGLHPEMGKLAELYRSGHVAIVQGAGYPNPILSHFQSMDVWHRATPDASIHDGWLADYLAATAGEAANPMYATSVTDVLSPALRGQGVTVASISSIENYQLRGDPRHPEDDQAFQDAATWIYGQDYGSQPLQSLVARTASSALASVAQVQGAVAAYRGSIEYPSFALANSLKTVAQLMAGNLGTRIYYVAFGGFDTHSAQAATHSRLLGGFSDSIDAFLRDVADQGKADRVLVMTFSEFGRRVHENASLGTDHGTAAPMLIIGSRVKGGLYGDHPSLTDLDANGNLKYGIDFRSVYGTVLEGWLGADQQATLGARYERLGFV